LNVKVKGQGHQRQKRAAHSQHPTVWTEWNALVADNVAKAAGATIRLLQRGVFAAMRALGPAGYRWALPRISSFFLNFYCHYITVFEDF